MKKNNKFLMALVTVATAAASIVATSACMWAFYQPEEPESLRNK